jgi:hypothetical protein
MFGMRQQLLAQSLPPVVAVHAHAQQAAVFGVRLRQPRKSMWPAIVPSSSRITQACRQPGFPPRSACR